MRLTSAVIFAGILCVVLPMGAAHGQVPADTSGELSLDSLLSIDVSAAAKHAQSTTEAPASVTVITSEDIARYGFRTLADVLATVRGFYTTYDHNYSYVGVRGFSRPGDFNDRVLLLWNGHTLNEDVYGSAMLGTDLGISLDHVSRIEIVRGPGSALYGTSAMLAVINVVTKNGNQINGVQGSTEVGGHGLFGGAVALGKQFASGLDLALNGTWTGIDGSDLGFPAPGGSTVTHNLDWDRFRGVSAQMQFRGLTVNGFATSRRKGIPTGSYETIPGDPRTQTRDQRRFLDLRYDDNLSDKMGLMLRGYYDQYFYDGAWAYEVTSRDSSKGEWMGAEGQWRWDVIPSNRIVVGTEIQDHRHATYRSWDVDTVYFDGDFPYNVQSVYLQDELQLGAYAAVTAGLRYDHYSESGSALSPRLALLLYPRQAGTIKLLYGEAFRAPNISERTIGNGVDVQQNPDLKPEKMRTYEAVWEKRVSRRVFVSASLYHYRIRDLIDQVEDTVTEVSEFANVSRTITTGAAADLSLELPGDRDVYFSYSYQDARDPGRQVHLTNSPFHLAQARVSTPIARYFRLSATGRYESARTTVKDTRTPPFFLASASLSFRPVNPLHPSAASFWQKSQLTLTVDNLFNNGYELPGGTEHTQAALPQYGRWVTLKLSVGL
jgi:iron complex outermembrane receptor protein